MKIATGLALAGFLSMGLFATANAQDPMSSMQCSASCNTGYAQCLQGMDPTMASTPTEGMSKMQMNADMATSCGQQAMACNQACWQM